MNNNSEQPQTATENWQERALRAEAALESTQAVLDELSTKVNHLEAQLRLAVAKRFGSSSEKTVAGQQSLFGDAFNEAEAIAEPFAAEPDLSEVKGHKRKKRKGQRDDLFEGLPEKVIEYRLPEEEMNCSCCGHERHIIGQEVSRELEIIPAQFQVKVHVQHIYGCRHCETHGDGSQSPIVVAPRPNRVYPKSIASPPLLLM